MNGFSISLEPLLKEHPHEAESIRRLERLLSQIPPGKTRFRWTLDRLCDLVQPQSKDELALILGELVVKGHLAYEIHVESPSTHAVVAKFGDYRDIPAEVADTSTGMLMPVQLEDLRFVYAVPAK